VDELRAKVESLTSDLQESRAHASQLEDGMGKLQSEMEACDRRLKSMQSELVELDASTAFFRRRILGIEKDLDHLGGKVDINLSTRLQNLESVVYDKAASHQELQDWVALNHVLEDVYGDRIDLDHFLDDTDGMGPLLPRIERIEHVLQIVVPVATP
jgi:chromosome segregation ATPase